MDYYLEPVLKIIICYDDYKDKGTYMRLLKHSKRIILTRSDQLASLFSFSFLFAKFIIIFIYRIWEKSSEVIIQSNEYIFNFK